MNVGRTKINEVPVDEYLLATKNELEKFHNAMQQREEYFAELEQTRPRISNGLLDSVDMNSYKDYKAEFIFCNGAVFNDEDKVKLEFCLNVFKDEPGRMYLPFKVRNIDYTDKLSINLENELEVGHGNYHVMMVEIVLNNNSIRLIRHYLDWDSIEEQLKNLLDMFGLLSIQEVVTKVDNQPQRFKINTDVETPLIEENEYQQMKPRQGSKFQQMKVTKKSLYTQMYEDQIPAIFHDRAPVDSQFHKQTAGQELNKGQSGTFKPIQPLPNIWSSRMKYMGF